MNHPAPPSSRLPPPLRPGLDAYGRQVLDLAGPRLVSLTVFGAVLTPDWRVGDSIHHALVLAADDLQLIGELSALGPGAARLGLAAPLVATPRLLETTRDSFPLEWLEIAACHEVLIGADLFHGLVFAPEHVRLQCERECAVLAIALRQRLIRAHRREPVPLADLAEQAPRPARLAPPAGRGAAGGAERARRRGGAGAGHGPPAARPRPRRAARHGRGRRPAPHPRRARGPRRPWLEPSSSWRWPCSRRGPAPPR